MTVGIIETYYPNVFVLRQRLKKLDEQQTWGGLKQVLAPEDHYLGCANTTFKNTCTENYPLFT